jgi:hypothetical protein
MLIQSLANQGRRCCATLILGPRSNAALPEWSFVTQPDKQESEHFTD